MRISHNWLKELLPHQYKTEEIAETLTDIGLEVEGVEVVESIRGGLKGVVIGKVLTRAQHPNADRLSVTTVDIGGDTPLNIVCGAPNVAAGQKVLVATIGTELYDHEGKSFTIKEAKVRGELSQGMICAEDELGLGESHEGIMVLPEDAVIGMNASEYFQITSDEVIEIGLTPNRADANSHYGTARDLRAALHLHKGFNQALNRVKTLDTAGLPASDFKITIENEVACKRYTGILIEQVKVGPSPDWMKTRLEAIGQRSVNNIVDITNYVMFELGQPLHAFDADKIAGRHIRVKNVAAGTPFLTLDGSSKNLDADDLLICDGNGDPMCIAGVYGGKDSGVTDTTVNIFLESAWFNPASVRRTSFRHNLRTESASHFEKGTDPEQCDEALLRAAYLMKEYAEAEVRFTFLDCYPGKSERTKVNINLPRVRTLIGKHLTAQEISATLTSLNIDIEEKDTDNWQVTIPSHKTDVSRQADVVEEIVRIYGLNNIEETGSFNFSMPDKVSNEDIEARHTVLQYLADAGYSEAMGLSIINSNNWAKITDNPDIKGIRINNTSNVQLDLMRPDPLATALETIAYNQSRQQSDIRMYEFGSIYDIDQKGYLEATFISLFGTGSLHEESWHIGKRKNLDPYYFKTTIQHLLKRIGIRKYQERNGTDERFENCLEIVLGPKVLAVTGNVRKKLVKNAGIKGSVVFAHIYWEEVLKLIHQKPIIFKEFSRFPVVRRDLAVVVPSTTDFEQIKTLIQKTAAPYLSDLKLFDVYSDEEQLGANKDSLSIALYFTNYEKTFDDKSIEEIMKKVMKAVEEKLDVLIRK
mgnify:FL=1